MAYPLFKIFPILKNAVFTFGKGKGEGKVFTRSHNVLDPIWIHDPSHLWASESKLKDD